MAAENKFVTSLHKYLAAFNNHDIDGVYAWLDDNLEITFEGKVVAQGSEAPRASYLSDFAAKSSVILDQVKNDSIVQEDTTGVEVVLIKLEDGKKSDEVGVTYVFRNSDLKMVKHHIHYAKKL